MPIEGHYQPKHPAPSAPYVRAIVELPRLNTWDFVHFLADTGADNTTMHPDDVSNLRIDFTRLNPPNSRSRGVGGQLDYHTEPANLHFLDGEHFITWHCENLRICAEIADPTLSRLMNGLPSLLGRNFLNLCLNTGDPRNNRFSLEPYRLDNQGSTPRIIL